MRKIVIFLVVCSFMVSSVNATIRYVKPGIHIFGGGTVPTGTGDGLSWANASDDLQLMINNSQEGDEIWVASGTYIPNRSINWINDLPVSGPYNTFLLKKNVKIFGGFSGNESSLSARNPSINTTTLSGLISLRPFPTGLHAYHVVTSVGDVGTACLDGFTIMNGSAIGTGSNTVTVGGYSYSVPNNYGGGICLINSSPKLQNLQIINNEADYGAAIYSTDTSVTIENVFINGNTANTQGIVYHAGTGGWFKFVNATICGNNSNNGWLIYNTSNYDIMVYNSVIWNNTRYGDIYRLPLCIYSCIQGNPYTGTGMVYNTTPNFVNPSANNYRLQANSPLRNAGSNSLISSTILYDLDWNTRKMGTIDIGAYEYQGKSLSPAQKSAGESFEDNDLELNELIINIFPNPATGQLNITSSVPFSKISIVNMLGQTVKTVEVGAENHIMNVSDMAKGLYLLKVDTPQGSTTKKIQIK